MTSGNTKNTREGAYALIVKDDRVLAVRYASPDGRWTLPGGEVAPDETLLGALHRKLVEETGSGVLPTGDPFLLVDDFKNLHVFPCVLASWQPLQPKSDENPLEWIPLDEVGTDKWPATPRLLEAVHRDRP